ADAAEQAAPVLLDEVEVDPDQLVDRLLQGAIGRVGGKQLGLGFGMPTCGQQLIELAHRAAIAQPVLLGPVEYLTLMGRSDRGLIGLEAGLYLLDIVLDPATTGLQNN